MTPPLAPGRVVIVQRGRWSAGRSQGSPLEHTASWASLFPAWKGRQHCHALGPFGAQWYNGMEKAWRSTCPPFPLSHESCGATSETRGLSV